MLAFVLAACRGGEPAPVLDTPPSSPIAAPSAGRALPEEPELCGVLASVVATEVEGFAPLRGRPLGAGQWRARTTLPGTERCTIEGEAWPRARYSCAGASFAAVSRSEAAAAFEALAGELDQCLLSPIWFPRTWRRGTTFDFAMGERLQAWTDRSTAPRSQVVLKVQQETPGQTYHMQLDLEAVP